jgi:3-oxoacyl-[acyl-carrier protein] reductase
MNLNGATALVTGGSSGIGFAIAKALADAGARVAITGRDEDKLARAAATIGGHAIRADVSLEADVERTMRDVVAAFGHLDILVNNAGIGVFKALVAQDLESFERVFATNVTGPMLMGREAAKHFITRKRGNIVNIASTAGTRGAPNGTAYYASKFALRGMTECWRGELRPHNIRVFLINPSEVLTPFFDPSSGAPADNPSKLHAEDIAHAVRSVLEMHDRGFTPELSIFATNPRD